MILMTDVFIYFDAFLLGVLSSFHCIGMCGAINIALFMNSFLKSSYLKYLYNLGRIISYGILGIIGGIFGTFLFNFVDNKYLFLFKFFSGLILFFISLNLINVFNRFAILERINFLMWNFISKYLKSFIPIKNYWQAIFVGIIWGNIPCGLLYGMLIWSISFGTIFKSFFIMTIFGFGTLPGMLLTINYLPNKNKKLILHKTSFVFLIICSLITMYAALFLNKCH